MRKKIETFAILVSDEKREGLMFRTTDNAVEYNEKIIDGFRKNYPDERVWSWTFSVVCDEKSSLDDILSGLKDYKFGDYFMSIFSEGIFIPYVVEEFAEEAYIPKDDMPMDFYFAFSPFGYAGNTTYNPWIIESEEAMKLTISQFQGAYSEENKLRRKLRIGEVNYRRER